MQLLVNTLNIVKKWRCFDDGTWTHGLPDTKQRWRWIITSFWFVHNKFKGKVYPVHAMTACKGSSCVSPLTPNFDTRWSPVRITPRKEPQYPMSRKLCGPQSQSGRFEEKKNFFPIPGIEHGNIQPVGRIAILTRLPRLLMSSIKQQHFMLRLLLYKFEKHKIHLINISESIPK